jgi:hypothetical protein
MKALNSTVAKLMTIVIVILIASIGYLTGNRLSQWGARIHPVEGWREWYASNGKKGIVRKEICPDDPYAVRLCGVAVTDDVWKASIGRAVRDIVPRSPYVCQVRIRGNGRSSVCLSIFDHVNQENLLEQFFTPPMEWHDYKFIFASGESKEVGVSLYVGAKSIDVDIASLTMSPVKVPMSAASNECVEQVIGNDTWSMLPVTSDGSTLLPAQMGDASSDAILKMPANGRPIKSIATRVFGVDGNKELTVQFEASSDPPTEILSWLSDANGNESEKQRIHLSKDIQMKQYSTPFLIPSTGYRLHLQPESTCELRIHSARIMTCSTPTLPKGTVDSRLMKLVADKGVTATIKRSLNPEGPITLTTEGDAVQSARFDVPLKVEGDKSSRILLKARADHPIQLRLVVAENHEPWDAISQAIDFEVTTEWKELELPFRSKVADARARLVVSWSDSKTTVDLSDIRLRTEEGISEKQGSEQ